ncbi:MAG: hypothetical protein K940chlam7_00875 [Chlamydiae bacterium]|nr:hypothetical protein [Chlamydiota bacterium]
MKRDIEQDLITWKAKKGRKPLLLRGARQVGKTYVVEKFGREHFSSFVKIDFEKQPEISRCFDTLIPEQIIAALELSVRSRIIPGETLLFFDEIQACPKAIMALRYFKEEMSNLHVIGAGSLLEFALKETDFRMPVGRVQYLFLKPLSFSEYLTSTENDILRERLQNVELSSPPDDVLHRRALQLTREFIALGGMPEVIAHFLQTKSYHDCQQIQASLLNTYRDDFAKYTTHTQYKYLQLLFEKTPGLIAQWFKYTKVDPSVDPRTLRIALEQLSDAGLICPVHATAASGIPLMSKVNRKKFKLLFLDVGLVLRACHLDLQLIMQENLMLINRGAIAEQFVGQELLAYLDRYEPRRIYFWIREKKGSSAEVDYVINVGGDVIPIEVKAGAAKRLLSLQLFMREKRTRVGVCISQAPLSYKDGVLFLPLYMVSELPRLIKNIHEG